ncbi:MAG: hypothetical protein J2P45_27365, partial [Candidatus Dormibacteraeota bacterium]|nr:hypothetical protein [Candidatus Dormibacteraeota bacterium]
MRRSPVARSLSRERPSWSKVLAQPADGHPEAAQNLPHVLGMADPAPLGGGLVEVPDRVRSEAGGGGRALWREGYVEL